MLEQFGHWLTENFGISSNSSDCTPGYLFGECDDEFSICAGGDISSHAVLVYNCRGEFYSDIYVRDTVNRARGDGILYTRQRLDLPADKGTAAMQQAAAKHDLRLDFRNGRVFVTCKKLWCLDRHFTLLPVNVDGDDLPRFRVEGANVYKPFPENPMLTDDQIHCFILHHMLLKQ